MLNLANYGRKLGYNQSMLIHVSLPVPSKPNKENILSLYQEGKRR